MNKQMKHVDFKRFCKICKHIDVPPFKDPCDECLSVLAREHSYKPVNFEEQPLKKRRID